MCNYHFGGLAANIFEQLGGCHYLRATKYFQPKLTHINIKCQKFVNVFFFISSKKFNIRMIISLFHSHVYMYHVFCIILCQKARITILFYMYYYNKFQQLMWYSMMISCKNYNQSLWSFDMHKFRWVKLTSSRWSIIWLNVFC